MIFKNYDYFVAITEEGSVSKAAEKLFVSQPSLSKYLKRLEENIGVELFNRNSYPLRLTEAGKLYFTYVKEIIAKEKKLKQGFEDIKKFSQGTIELGITVWRSSIILPTVLQEFWIKFPNIRIEVNEGSHQYIASLLENDKIDFAVFNLPNSYKNVTFEHLYYERILFAVNQNNPLLKKIKFDNRVDVSVLCKEDFMLFAYEPFILLKQGQNIREISQNYLNKLSIVPKIALETSNIVTATNMVMLDMGVTFVPEAVLQIKSQTVGLVFFEVDYPSLKWEVGIAYKTGNTLSKQSRIFINFIRKGFSVL